MNSREKILRQLRFQVVPTVDLPQMEMEFGTCYDDPVEKFSEMVRLAGAQCETVGSINEVRERLKVYPEFGSAKRILSLVDDIPGNTDMELVDRPQDLEDLDFVICPGRFAVSENGAVWLTDEAIRYRVCLFITQFLVLVIHAEDIVHNMHQAYRLAEPPLPGFGLFLAGPSKTADIEQSLVIGAHGCRELQIFITRSSG